MHLQLAIAQLEFARVYTRTLLADVQPDEWYMQPAGATTHLAWQVGHLAMAEYGLCLFRQRGRRELDLELMTGAFRKQFSRGSTPQRPEPAGEGQTEARPVAPVADILATWERVHQQTLLELPTLTDEQLAEPVEAPYAAYPNKLGCLLFCSHHEMLHAGQIGLLRRLLGKTPIR